MADNTGRDDQIIELTDVVTAGNEAAPGNVDDTVEEPIIELTDVATRPDGLPMEESPVHPVDLTQAQMEAALERVIEKKFAEKIESILFDVMERVIAKEIKEIRENLQKDLDQIGTS